MTKPASSEGIEAGTERKVATRGEGGRGDIDQINIGRFRTQKKKLQIWKEEKTKIFTVVLNWDW